VTRIRGGSNDGLVAEDIGQNEVGFGDRIRHVKRQKPQQVPG